MDPRPDPRPLALAMPLLLFTQGIVAWVDELDGRSGDGALGATSAVLLLATVASAFWLAALLAAVLPRGLGTSSGVVAAGVGAAATAVVILGDPRSPLDGVFDGVFGSVVGTVLRHAPAAVTTGGPVLVGAGLAVLLVILARTGRMPLGSLALAAIAALVVASPFALVPLGAVLLLIAFGPLLRGPETGEPEPSTLLPARLEPAGPARAGGRIRAAGGPAAYDLEGRDVGKRSGQVEGWQPARVP